MQQSFPVLSSLRLSTTDAGIAYFSSDAGILGWVCPSAQDSFFDWYPISRSDKASSSTRDLVDLYLGFLDNR